MDVPVAAILAALGATDLRAALRRRELTPNNKACGRDDALTGYLTESALLS